MGPSSGGGGLEVKGEFSHKLRYLVGGAFTGTTTTLAQVLRTRLPALDLPVLVANGAHDVMVHAFHSWVLSQRLPDAAQDLLARAHDEAPSPRRPPSVWVVIVVSSLFRFELIDP